MLDHALEALFQGVDRLDDAVDLIPSAVVQRLFGNLPLGHSIHLFRHLHHRVDDSGGKHAGNDGDQQQHAEQDG